MKATKRYLKILSLISTLIISLLSGGLAIILGIVSIIGMFASGDIGMVLLVMLAALGFGLMSAIFYDLMEWLNAKFIPM